MQKYQLSALGGAILLLTACGGGGGSGNDTTTTTPSTPTPTCTNSQYLENNVCKDKASQSITGLSLSNTVNVDQVITLSAQSSAGLPLTYTSKTESTCQVTDELNQQKLEMLGVGVCTVEASQAGNAKTLAASSVSASTTILPILTTTGISLCGNNDQNNVLCNAANLAELLGLGQDGEKQTGRKMGYEQLSVNNDHCIRDQVTGLVWEQKTADGKLRDKDWRYAWFNADAKTNDGQAGSQASASTCGNTLASCNTTAYIEALNKNKYCGYSDWRLPTRAELANLVDYSTSQPALNAVFINTPFTDAYWSSTTSAKQNSKAWMADFKDGALSPNFKEYMGHIRAVRTAQ
ncbi:DUF1566 domain-containing protein [Acinetobacter ursingii]|uniref:Lcl C-terminal domain-containing protein n=1 Tax=Acinetobacter ursingii TaxID=108980 RepID=UPI0012506C07|nr:DUF1566 domain-containing protein [Acinetobacter ursingii]MDG9949783.1 DUF1566 domain-containing protein [Acinetobacter ursingii]MDH2104949.1 DUF1566 domain-containing protein [Acinetobacter ursingii]